HGTDDEGDAPASPKRTSTDVRHCAVPPPLRSPLETSPTPGNVAPQADGPARRPSNTPSADRTSEENVRCCAGRRSIEASAAEGSWATAGRTEWSSTGVPTSARRRDRRREESGRRARAVAVPGRRLVR